MMEAVWDRREQERFGMWIFLASEVLFFGVLMLAFGVMRRQWPEAFEAASGRTHVVSGSLNTAILLTSSLLVAIAAEASRLRSQGLARRALIAAAWLGVAFLVVKGHEYLLEWREGLFPRFDFRWPQTEASLRRGAELFFMWMYTVTWLHALHLSIGIVWIALEARRARRPQWRFPVAAGLYWHFVDAVWILLYPLIYLSGPHA